MKFFKKGYHPNTLHLKEIKWLDHKPIFYVSDYLHLTPSAFELEQINNPKIIQNFSAEDAFMIGRIINDTYHKSCLYDAADTYPDGRLKLYCKSVPNDYLNAHLHNIFEHEDIIEKCTSRLIKYLVFEKVKLENAAFLRSLNNFNTSDESPKGSNIIQLSNAKITE